MEGNEFVWIASIILGLTILGWLVMDWLESTQQWDAQEGPNPDQTPALLGRSEQQALDALDAELELMLSYPLDPFAPALLWRPLAQAEWAAENELSQSAAANQTDARHGLEPGSLLNTGEAAS